MIEAIDDNTYSIETAGLGGDERMHVYMPPCQCGQIKNGVDLNVGHGGWVVDTNDFLALADRIREALEAEMSPEQDSNEQ